jgi:hypothetical protein
VSFTFLAAATPALQMMRAYGSFLFVGRFNRNRSKCFLLLFDFIKLVEVLRLKKNDFDVGDKIEVAACFGTVRV